MCIYCGKAINGHAVELMVEENILHLCDEECAILYFQEQQQNGLHSWLKIRA